MEHKEPRPLSEFNMKEIYRLISRERIPGFNMLGSERRYLDEYREALMRQMEIENAETTKTVDEDKDEEAHPTTKKRKNSRKKKEEPAEVEETTEVESTEEKPGLNVELLDEFDGSHVEEEER